MLQQELKCFKEKIKIKKIQKNSNPPSSPDGAVVHDSSSVGARGLERDKATSHL
jgi:hypothetical protein